MARGVRDEWDAETQVVVVRATVPDWHTDWLTATSKATHGPRTAGHASSTAVPVRKPLLASEGSLTPRRRWLLLREKVPRPPPGDRA